MSYVALTAPAWAAASALSGQAVSSAHEGQNKGDFMCDRKWISMFARLVVLGVSCSALWIGCADQPLDTQPAGDTQEIINNLVSAGFAADDIMVVDGVVHVGNDAEVTLAASREMLKDSHGKEQYRTTNLVSGSLTKICVNGSAFTGVFSTALDLAIQNYNDQPLTFAMARTPSSGCSFTINGVILPGVVGGSAGFPSGGL